MFLLITQAEYQSHKALQALTTGHTNHEINSVDYIHCEIIDVAGYGEIEPIINDDNYVDGDGILLAPEAFAK